MRNLCILRIKFEQLEYLDGCSLICYRRKCFRRNFREEVNINIAGRSTRNSLLWMCRFSILYTVIPSSMHSTYESTYLEVNQYIKEAPVEEVRETNDSAVPEIECCVNIVRFSNGYWRENLFASNKVGNWWMVIQAYRIYRVFQFQSKACHYIRMYIHTYMFNILKIHSEHKIDRFKHAYCQPFAIKKMRCLKNVTILYAITVY